jgi:hypothetical protein
MRNSGRARSLAAMLCLSCALLTHDALRLSLSARCGSVWSKTVHILLLSTSVAPGGTLVDDGIERSPFYILNASKNFESVKLYCEVIVKLNRRYKYLQKCFEETTRKILQYINRFSADENEKFAMSLGYFTATGNLPISVLNALFKDYLVKEG